MSKLFSQITLPTALLFIFLVIIAVSGGLYSSCGIEPPAIYTLLRALGFIWIIGWWLQIDSRKHGVKWVLDIGLFLYIAWPFIMLYYLFKTRGIRSFLTILIFVGVYVGAYLIGVFLYIVLTP